MKLMLISSVISAPTDLPAKVNLESVIIISRLAAADNLHMLSHRRTCADCQQMLSG